ncbi:MAG: thermitase [Thermoplasmata archaeon]|nr:thermitase [Thermoplasmata archaeon]
MARAIFVLITTLAIVLALAPVALVADAAPAPGDYVIGFHHAPPAGWAGSHGFAAAKRLDRLSAVVVHGAPLATLQRAAHDPNVAYIEPNQPLHTDSTGWDGTGWDGTGWDGTGWDGTGWDGTGWDGTGWDGTGWDGTGWDGTGWDGTGWDGTGWDGTGWDGTGWDGTGWDGTGWDATPDPGYAQQWGLAAVHAPEAWNLSVGTGAVTVCFLDTGIDATHPDLAAHVYTNPADGSHGYNVMDGSHDVTDDVGHGTYVAGIAGAIGGNSAGIVGLAQEKLLPVKVMNASGGSEADLAAGILTCLDHGARVLSMSLHTTEPSQLLDQAIDQALAAGAVVVAAAGNDGTDQVSYPASHPGVIAVGAANGTAELAPFSNHGDRLDVVAPGVGIVSTVPGALYAGAGGTSAAVPFVSATAALMLDLNPSLSGAQVGSLIEAHARDLGAPGKDTTFGYGGLDTAASLKAAVGQ